MARALVYAHHDRDGVFDPHVVEALRRYRPLIDHVTVVSTTAQQLPVAMRPVVDRFLARDNIGYDFSSWRAGLEALGQPDRFDEIVCANDSVYGPLFDLEPAFTDARVAASDLWGMCLSEQGTKRRGRVACPHVQSWWFTMRKPLLASRAFSAFWNGVVPLATKDDIVDRYEIGMSEHFARAGFRIASLYDAGRAGPVTWRELRPHLSLWQPTRSRRHIRKARQMPHNPSELVWKRLLAAGVPFIKVGLFRVNHYGLDLEHVLAGLEADTPYDVGLIRAHLQRVGRS
jgi:lipopolysaccharide biosynthesis protein